MALGFMRRHRRWLYVFLWLVILTFVIFFGIPMDEIAGTEGGGATVGEVGDRRITAAEFQRAYADQRRFIQRRYGDRLDEETLKRLGLEEQTLQRLINEHVLDQEAERLGLIVDDDSLKAFIEQHPDFQVNGRFVGGAELKRIMERQGLTVQHFEKEMRATLLRERLHDLVTDAVTVTEAEVEAEHRRRNERVKVEYVLAAADPTTVAVTDEEVKAHFEKEKESYRLPERRVLSYILLDPALVQSRITLNDREKRAYYDAHKDEYRREEEVCAAHVLVKVRSDEQPEGHPEEAARALAQKALDEVRAGKDFAEVARRSSEDQGTAPKGGDMGCFGRGQTVPEFDQVVFSLKPGEVSDLVRTPHGFHVMKVNTRREESVEDFEAVKPRIEQALMSQRGRDVLTQLASAIGDALGAGRSLEDAAQEQGVAVQKSAPLARGEAKPPLGSPAILARAFELTRGQT
ncbi:MAG TPA: SurA N-terminal domain-containing protein, partial [Vicinamibacteria bacterium]|nr:SurA N-terminal domain-containing protein [Vicinamibacteria bacterium]